MRSLAGKQITFVGPVVLVSVAFVCLLLPFSGALLWAVILAFHFDPLQRRLVRALHLRESLAAAVSVLVCICILVIPGSHAAYHAGSER